jgi:hypothetical protein
MQPIRLGNLRGRPATRGRALAPAVALLFFSSIALAQVSPGAEVKIEGPKVTYYPDGRIEGSGGIRATYEDITVTGDDIRGNIDAEWIELTGNVTIEQRGQQGFGEGVYIDLKRKTWRLTQARTDLSPEYLEGEVVSPVFARGEEVIGESDKATIEQGWFTTCDLEHPHYLIKSKSLTIYPNKKLVAKHVSAFLLGKRLFTVGSFVIPLRRAGERAPFVPEVGRSDDEGFYIKNSYNYLLQRGSYGTLKLDWMQRKGWGYGVEQDYRFGGSSGTLSAYTLHDNRTKARTLTATIEHSGKLAGYDLRLRHDLRRNSYLYAPATRTRSTSFTVSGGGEKSRTNLSFFERETGGAFSSSNLTANLLQTAQLGQKTDLRLNLTYSKWGSTGQQKESPDTELWNKAELRHSWNSVDAALAYEDRIDLDRNKNTQDDSRFAFERTPELTFSSDTSRIGRQFLGRGRADFSVSLGHFAERPSGVSTERVLFDTDLSFPQRPLIGSSTLSFSGGFKQAIYGDNTAQWVANGRTSIAIPIAKKIGFSISHRFRKHRGYAPFIVDQELRENILSGGLDIGRRDSRYGLSVGSGYDFVKDDYNWQTLALRTWGRPTGWLDYEASGGYDLARGLWKPLLLKLDISRAPRLSAQFGVRYDLEGGQVVQVRSIIDASVGKRWRMQAMLGYNGLSKSFDYRNIMITRDLHCWEASLAVMDEAGYPGRNTVLFELRLKALPAARRFGTSSSGSAFDSSVGWGF